MRINTSFNDFKKKTYKEKKSNLALMTHGEFQIYKRIFTTSLPNFRGFSQKSAKYFNVRSERINEGVCTTDGSRTQNPHARRLTRSKKQLEKIDRVSNKSLEEKYKGMCHDLVK